MWILLMVLCVVTGGSSLMAGGDNVAPQIGDEGTKAASQEAVDKGEIVDPNKSDLQSPGGQQDGQDLTGTQASSTQIEKGGLQEDEWDSELSKFRPYKTPLLSIMRKITKTITVSNWAVKHMRVGGETLDGLTTAKITGADTIKLTPANFSGSLLPFYKGSTVIVPKVAGYKRGSQTQTEGRLMLVVVEKNKNEVTLQAVNGKAKTEDADCEILDNMTCPDIPEGSLLLCASTALSESQMNVPPENFQPRSKEVYLQKRAFSIIFTDDYEKVKKKQPLTVADMKADALTKFLLRQERTYWMGVKARDGSIGVGETLEGHVHFVVVLKHLVATFANLDVLQSLYSVLTAECKHAVGLCKFGELQLAYGCQVRKLIYVADFVSVCKLWDKTL